jgi:hypothetical protein
MRQTQGWGWLVAGVLAAALNASYHDGGLEWAHRVADHFATRSQAVLASTLSTTLSATTGRAEKFLVQAQLVKARHETTSCPLASTFARIQTGVAQWHAQSRGQFDQFEAMSAREEAGLARLEANRAQMEAKMAAVQAAQVARFRFASASFNPASFRVSAREICPRVRVNVPKLMKMPVAPEIHVPEIHVEVGGQGPV